MIDSPMLVTTCPDCDTTFKLTVAILERAGGQVRCGRCTRIFDANSRLREQPESGTEQLPAAARAHGDAPTDDELAFVEAVASTTGTRWFLQDDPPDTAADIAAAVQSGKVDFDLGIADIEPDESEDVPAAAAAAAAAEPEAAGPEIADAENVDWALADPAIVQAETTVAETPEPEDAVADPAVAGPPTSIDRAAANAAAAAPDWREDTPEPVRRRTWPWAVGAGLLTLTLAGQLIHAARSELAALPGVGPALIAVYAKLGREVAPPVALEQFSSLDLTAFAEPVTDEHGWLIIETRVQNRGPKVQAYPHILVRILDRWQETIAGRYFAPDEYVVTPQSDYSRMNVGSIVDAQFIIVDPGPSATGFELEFCARIEDAFVCDSQ